MFRKQTINNFILIAAIALPTSAMSKDISYDYVQGTYSSISDSGLPGFEVDADGFAFFGSFGVTPNIALTAGYEVISYDRVLGLDFDFTAFTFGLTAHTSIAPKTDIFGNFSVLNVNAEISDGFTTQNDDDTGNTITGGLRQIISNAVELDFSLTREDIYDGTSNIFKFGARFYANETFSVGVGYRTGNDDVDAILLNARIDIK